MLAPDEGAYCCARNMEAPKSLKLLTCFDYASKEAAQTDNSRRSHPLKLGTKAINLSWSARFFAGGALAAIRTPMCSLQFRRALGVVGCHD